jgi:hypothetical protein
LALLEYKAELITYFNEQKAAWRVARLSRVEERVRVVHQAVEDGVARVGSPISSCLLSTGIWLVTRVERWP